MNNAEQGLYHKYHVTRTDGSSAVGCKHEHCEYFVLDLTHDPLAYDALTIYAANCRDKYPLLYRDLCEKLRVMHEAQVAHFRRGDA